MMLMLALLSLLMTSTPNTSAQNEMLQCRDSSPACIQTLTSQALNASPEIKVLDEAIKLNKTKLWTNYLAANALNPLSLALQVARNIAGGGDVAQSKLTSAQLKAQRFALEATLRATILQIVADYQTAVRAEATSRDALTSHLQRLQIIEVSYRAGDLTTEELLLLYAQSDQLRAQIKTNSTAAHTALAKLREIVNPTRVERKNK